MCPSHCVLIFLPPSTGAPEGRGSDVLRERRLMEQQTSEGEGPASCEMHGQWKHIVVRWTVRLAWGQEDGSGTQLPSVETHIENHHRCNSRWHGLYSGFQILVRSHGLVPALQVTSAQVCFMSGSPRGALLFLMHQPQVSKVMSTSPRFQQPRLPGSRTPNMVSGRVW